jgi:hypothetical protein
LPQPHTFASAVAPHTSDEHQQMIAVAAKGQGY